MPPAPAHRALRSWRRPEPRPWPALPSRTSCSEGNASVCSVQFSGHRELEMWPVWLRTQMLPRMPCNSFKTELPRPHEAPGHRRAQPGACWPQRRHPALAGTRGRGPCTLDDGGAGTQTLRSPDPPLVLSPALLVRRASPKSCGRGLAKVSPVFRQGSLPPGVLA